MNERNKQIKPGLVVIAGNAVMDILVNDVAAVQGDAADAWQSNVQLLNQPVTPVLGGGGAASAYVLGRLGQSVTLYSNLGSDIWAGQINCWLQQANVDIALRDPSVSATAVNIILLTPEGRRTAFYFTGKKVDWQGVLKQPTPEWVLVSGYGAVDEEDAALLLSVFRELRTCGTRIMFDPGPWFAGRISNEIMYALWADANYLVATEDELRAWLPAESIAELVAGVLDFDLDGVVIKRGAAGVTCAGGGSQIEHIAVTPVESANSVGAGDSFNARLLFGLCRGESLVIAVRAAAELATGVVQQGRGVIGAFA